MAREKGIRVSEKYGVNPSLTLCFWCGKQTGIAFYGKLKGDVEAPEYTFTGYDFCDDCKEKLKNGIALIEVIDTPKVEGLPPIQGNLYPTGGIIGLTVEAVRGMFGEDYTKHNVILMDSKTFRVIFDKVQKVQGDKNE